MTEGKRRRAREFVELTREVVASEHAPLPLVDDPRCRRCSHVGVCLPDENRGAIRSRTVSIRDPDGQVLHITTPGSRASLKAGRVVVRTGADELSSIPLERVQGLVVHGNADVSSALIRELLWRRVSIVWASFRGRVIGFAQSTESPNGAARIHQRCLSESQALALGRESVSSKVANQATQLRRSARADVSNEVHRLRDIAKAMSEAPDVRYLLGLEGEAAAVYFSRFTCMMHPDRGRLFIDRWPGREGRGACDPLNVALNVAYSALLADVLRSVAACGLDAHAGFLHSSSRNKPAFALDLMEQFRPVVAESAVLSAINNGELKASMFIDVMGSFRISDAGRRALLAAYERRVEQRFRHPVFGYRVTWRRAMEVQARMVLSVVDGTQRRYRGVRTR